MSRKLSRELVVHMLYAHDLSGADADTLLKNIRDEEYFKSLANEARVYSVPPAEAQEEYVTELIQGVLAHVPELDSYIEKYAKGWNVGRISRVTKAILRLSMYELLYLGIPVGASVNEALELAKRYDSEEASSFVNGVIGAFVKQELPQ